MNKYDLDFRRIEDVLRDILGIDIKRITDKNSLNDALLYLKMRINKDIGELNERLDQLHKNSSSSILALRREKKELSNEIVGQIAGETDFNKVLKWCINIRATILLSLDYKACLDDETKPSPNNNFPNLKEYKSFKRLQVYGLNEFFETLKISPYELICQRNNLFNYIDYENRIVEYSKPVLDSQSENKDEMATQEKLAISFFKQPRRITEPGLQSEELQVYKLGEIAYSVFPDESDNFKIELIRKSLVGVIKEDEFGELKQYTVFMNDIPTNLSPEFCRDVLFSDMLLRNAKNNMGFLGVPEKLPQDEKYGYRISFSDVGIEDLLAAIDKAEKAQNDILVNSNWHGVSNITSAFQAMQLKMEQIIKSIKRKNDFDEPGGR